MSNLPSGQSKQSAKQALALGGLTIADTEYSQEFVDWHSHDNPHFTLITRGGICQGTSQATYECPSGTLLFHNQQEPHYNLRPKGITHGFQVEIHSEWSQKFKLAWHALPPSKNVIHPGTKLLFHRIYKESKLTDDVSCLTIDALLLELFSAVRGFETVKGNTRPGWVKKLDDLLHDQFNQPLSLQTLAIELNLHWAHLSREFPRYFHCTFGEYVRKIRVEKSLALLRNKTLSLTDIAFQCGFADQSHFIRCFKEFTGTTPRTFRKISS